MCEADESMKKAMKNAASAYQSVTPGTGGGEAGSASETLLCLNQGISRGCT
jgi:hypothetical protein